LIGSVRLPSGGTECFPVKQLYSTPRSRTLGIRLRCGFLLFLTSQALSKQRQTLPPNGKCPVWGGDDPWSFCSLYQLSSSPGDFQPIMTNPGAPLPKSITPPPSIFSTIRWRAELLTSQYSPPFLSPSPVDFFTLLGPLFTLPLFRLPPNLPEKHARTVQSPLSPPQYKCFSSTTLAAPCLTFGFPEPAHFYFVCDMILKKRFFPSYASPLVIYFAI